MTNKEFYGDKLLAVALENACRKLHKAVYGESCADKECKDCEFYTVENVEKWLNAEHEEPELPLLENGNDLKPGDWIMVRDEDEELWFKNRFVCYYNSTFFVVDDNRNDGFNENGTNITGWEQARLPEEGE